MARCEGAGLQSQSSAGGGEAGTFTYLHREYVWGPGDRGIDELLAVFTGTHPSDGLAPRTPWYAITDTGGDVVALVEITSPGTAQAQAHVAAQWTYDPYGNVQSADYIRPHPHISVGHKGLFAERLDVPLIDFMAESANPTLTPFSRIHYHTRNRVLDPTLGRWLQRDPNATGQAVVESMDFHGRQAECQVVEIGLEEHMEDGMNTHQYVLSNPVRGNDPLGLFAYLDLLAAGALRAAALVMPGPSGIITGAMEGLVSEYSTNLSWDVNWAMDWSAPDDAHSRLDNNWIKMAMLEGIYGEFDVSSPMTDIGGNLLDVVLSKKKSDGPKLPKTWVRGAGAVGKFSNGWTFRVDTNNVRDAEGGFHMHVYDSSGKEVAKINGKGGWQSSHKGNTLKRPSEFPSAVRNEVNRAVRRASAALNP